MAKSSRLPPARAEHIGSFLRPLELHAELERVYAPKHTALLAEERAKDLSRLHALEDKYIKEVIKKQREVGLSVLTDGEFRRYMFTGSFYDSVDGLEVGGPGVAFYDNEGKELRYQGLPVVSRRLRRVDNPLVRETKFMKANAGDSRFKVTIPAGSFYELPFVYQNGVTEKVYKSHEELVEHINALQYEQIDEAIAAGLDYIQFDYPLYPMLISQLYLDIFNQMGASFKQLMDRSIAADRKIAERLPAHVTRAIHLCRGNWRSRFMVSGSLEPVAERMFNELPYDGFFIEWEDIKREGGYEALRFVPKGKMVIMGIVNSKVAEVESADSLVRKIESAAKYLDISQLGISPQCGFASTMHGNELDETAQWRKLEEMVKAADKVWANASIAV
jgi:5-methyltetrahydropteroyltriglutamate--homocysteine methyltransferase